MDNHRQNFQPNWPLLRRKGINEDKEVRVFNCYALGYRYVCEVAGNLEERLGAVTGIYGLHNGSVGKSAIRMRDSSGIHQIALTVLLKLRHIWDVWVFT